MTLAERRKYWADHIRGMRQLANEWLVAAHESPADYFWQRHCRDEAQRLRLIAKQYLKTTRSFGK
jgi:hypothetical protein